MFNRSKNPFLYRLSIYGIGFFIGLLISIKYCEKRGDNDFVKRVKGDTFPDIRALDLEGDSILLSDYNKDLVLLNFWSSSSPSCRAYNVELVDLAVKMNKERKSNVSFRIFSINIDASKDVWRECVKEDSLFWNTHSHLQSPSLGYYGIRELPCVYLLDTSNMIIAKTTNTKALKHEISLWK